MKLNISNVESSIAEGIDFVKDILGISLCKEGIQVDIKKGDRFTVSLEVSSINIIYVNTVQIFRGLSLAVQNLKKGIYGEIKEEVNFNSSGPMLDMSRNGVMTVEALKKMIRMIALMGLNRLYLYLEDIYEVKSSPYFGYMRGRYSQSELKEVDEYANIFGIEVIPAIQTLGHLETALRWRYTKDIKDTKEVLLADEPNTYAFIKELITSISSCFRTDKIHLGMDEATSLGSGQFMKKYGYKNKTDIMMSHLYEVITIVRNLGLKPIIWSDMFFRFMSKSHDYYDTEAVISEDLNKRIPEGLTLVYWDYYYHDEAVYDVMIKKHQQLQSDIIFAGGIWTWNSSVTNYRKTFETLQPGLKSCRKNKIKDIIITIWGDDGTEANYFSALLGLQLIAEFTYGYFDSGELRERFKTCTRGEYDLFWLMSRFDDTPGTDYKHGVDPVYNPSKYCLWQDLLMGLFDKNISKVPLQQHYEELYGIYKNIDINDDWMLLHKYCRNLAMTLSLKTNAGVLIKEAYDNNDMDKIFNIAHKLLDTLHKSVLELHKTHRELWFQTYKAFGWEVLDIRYGGLLQRILSVQQRLKEYIKGDVERIEELEVERLLYDGGYHFNNQPLINEDKYASCVTANQFLNNTNG